MGDDRPGVHPIRAIDQFVDPAGVCRDKEINHIGE